MALRSWSDSIEIAKPVDQVFAFLADPSTGVRWIKGVTKVELLDAPPARVGMRFRATRTVGSRTTTEEIRVIELSPPTLFAVGAGLMGGGIDLRVAYHLSPSGTGTRVESTTTAEPKTFGSRLMFGMFWKAVTANDAGNLRTLKSILEGP